MKKIYSIFAVLIAALCSMAASASIPDDETRTVTIHCNDPEHFQMRNSSSSPYYTFDSEGNTTAVFNAEYNDYKDKLQYIQASATEGYLIKSVDNKAGENVTPWDKNSLPYAFADIYGFNNGEWLVEDNDVITVIVEPEADNKTIVTVNANPEHIENVKFYSSVVDPKESGKWEIDITGVSGWIEITPNSSAKITKVTSEDGTEISKGFFSYGAWKIYSSDIKESSTLVVETKTYDELRSASMTVSVTEGDFNDLKIQRKDGSVVAMESATQVIKYNPDEETPFKFGRVSDAWSDLYSVTIVGEPENSSVVKDSYYHSYSVTPTDGCTVEVVVTKDIDVPIHFTFTNEGTSEAVSSVTVDDEKYTQGEWLADDFTVKYGSKVYITYSDIYDLNTITVNNENQPDAYFRSFTVTAEEYTIEIDATKKPVTTITVNCEAWENVIVQTSSSNYYLTGETTVIELPQSTYKIYVKGQNGYIINAVYDSSNEDVYSSNGFYINNGDTFTVDAGVFERDLKAMAYLEDTAWSDSYIRLAPYAENDKYVDLTPGYTEVSFAKGDFQKYGSLNFYLPNYSRGIIYLNDQVVEYDYGEYPDIEKIKDGDVLKIFAEEKTPHTVTYSIADDVAAEVWHDHITPIDAPESHDVLPGTQIHIKPATKARTADVALKVTVNDSEIEPGEDGVYSIVADGPKTIKVENNISTSISEINAAASAKAYDLQGRRVSTSTRGIIIVNGKKIKN